MSSVSGHSAPADAPGGYSVEDARLFRWDSVSDTVLPERIDLLDRQVVGRTVLDAGCGGGGIAEHLHRRGFTVTGLERFRPFLELANARDIRGHFVQADLSSPLPFGDRTFDTTICLDVLEHVDDDLQTLKELARVTRRRLVITVPQRDDWMTRYRLVFSTYRDTTHRRYYTRESLRSAAETIGLVHDCVHPRSRLPFLTPIYERVFHFLALRTAASEVHMNLAVIIDLDPQRSLA
jgi:SAM-dependent methyltransferase